jgi:hypothetical protein
MNASLKDSEDTLSAWNIQTKFGPRLGEQPHQAYLPWST